MTDIESLRLELEAERHSHRKDNEYLCGECSRLRAENERRGAVLEQIAAREPELDSLELARAFRELREITKLARQAITNGKPEKGQ